MSLTDDLGAASAPTTMPTYAETDGSSGHAAAFLPHENATPAELVAAAGLDPEIWQLVGRVNTRRWMRYDGLFLYYYKFDVEQGESAEARQLHIGELTKLIRRRKVPGGYQSRRPFATPATYSLGIADWQMGKAEGGEGSDSTIQRYLNGLEEAEIEVKALRKRNARLDNLALLSTGDLVEGCGGHYDMQTFSVDLDRREQNRVVRELLTTTIRTLAPMFDHTTVAAVPGNHGENRHKGKAFTNFSDNDDVATVEAVSEAFDLAGWSSDQLEFVWSEGDELSLLVELSGVPIALAHGHQFRGGVNALKKAEDWWRGQDFGHQAARGAQLLLSGHFHSYHNVNLAGNRSWIQQPTIDPGSAWFTGGSGITATRGVLSMVLDARHPLGYDNLRVLPVG